MDIQFIVRCECGFEDRYDDHSAASAGQAGHSSHCFGNRTRIDTRREVSGDE